MKLPWEKLNAIAREIGWSAPFAARILAAAEADVAEANPMYARMLKEYERLEAENAKLRAETAGPDTMSDHRYFCISPLGAAVVEAMPDRKRIAAIKRSFRRGKGVASQFFTQEEADRWAKQYAQESNPNG